jgi:phage recombination protein Bet
MTFAENPIEKEDPRLDAELVMRSELSPDQINLVKNTIAKGATDDELELFITQCNRTQLDPFSRQIYLIGRWDGRLRTEVKQAQISIDGARLVAQRSREYRGQTEVYYCDVDEVWHDVWLKPHPPRAAKVGVYRAGFVEAVWATATWDQYVQTNKEGQPGPMWKKMGALMLGKCAEALALRKAFPMELSGLCTTEEMMQATSAPAVAPNPGGAVTDDGEVTTTRMGPPSGAQGATAAHTEDVELLRSLIVSMSPSAKVAMATRWKESSIPPLDHGLTDVECAAATSLAYDVMADDALAGDVVDAEIVNEGSEEAGDQGIGFEVKLVSQKMVSAIYALFKDIGIPDHDDNHDEAERILGLDDLRSFKNLSMAEGKKLIDTLQARKDAL